ncbi:class I SAM-dependent methyltransferase [Amycolatopsis sp. cg9]|uniref:class I SAM-dependent DNA methyltransferase n=1 Tax=Amycolatopsis sp. cg9 TaxID=3238801 RepID=UPI003525C749
MRKEATMGNYYSEGFASFFDNSYTGWVNRFSPKLVAHLATVPGTDRTAVDICCGTGVTAACFLDAGWTLHGVDGSKSMLDLARARHAGAIEAGRFSVVQSDARAFRLPAPVSACVSMDGALNHLPSTEDLRACFSAAHAALAPGGEFVFDLYEQTHFLHWNHVTLTDTDEAVVVKRGVWDTDTRTGMLRVSGVFGAGDRVQRVDQTLTSWYYDAEDVTTALRAAGFEPLPHGFGGEDLKCDSGSCSRTAVPCRAIYRARKP